MIRRPSGLEIDESNDLLSLTLNRGKAANALSPDLVEDLISVFEQERTTRLCVLRGEGKQFCAGFDLSDLDDLSDGDLLWRFLRIEHLLQLVHHAPFPVAAFAHGQVVGAGADLFAACWQRVAAPDAKFRMPGWNFEIALGTRRLARLVGDTAARDLLVDTRAVAAGPALDMGLATHVEEPADWPATIDTLHKRTRALPLNALHQMFGLTTGDTRAEDIAALVRTAGRPGLRERIMAYRERIIAAKKAKDTAA